MRLPDSQQAEVLRRLFVAPLGGLSQTFEEYL
jgi:hypothetical protein